LINLPSDLALEKGAKDSLFELFAGTPKMEKYFGFAKICR
jgi:hypothetical protein